MKAFSSAARARRAMALFSCLAILGCAPKAQVMLSPNYNP